MSVMFASLANDFRPFSLVSMLLSAAFTVFIAVYLDTKFYTDQSVTWSYLFKHPTITPLNNIKYNMSTSNLESHGLHPWYQHILFNLPQLLGPAMLLFIHRPHLSLRLYSAISAVFVLSFSPHQEARFLVPTIPLFLSCFNLPKNHSHLRVWAGAWIAFNTIFGLLMGLYHQGGIVPTQVFVSHDIPDATEAVWWKTYTPPIWLLNGKNEVLTTHDIMGMPGPQMLDNLRGLAPCLFSKEQEGTYLIAPLSASFLDTFLANLTTSEPEKDLRFQEVWRYNTHLNLDDMDFAEDGFWSTIWRVIGRRGIGAWRVTRDCG